MGKSSLYLKYKDHKSKLCYEASLGIDLFTRFVNINDNHVKLEIYDTVSDSISKIQFKLAERLLFLIMKFKARSSQISSINNVFYTLCEWCDACL